MNHRLLVFLFPMIIFLVSCLDNEDPKPSKAASQYLGGVFITNEGNYGDADGSLSFISKEGEVFNQAYSAANPEKSLGDVVQSSWIADSLLFVVVNNSNKVEVMNLNDTLRLAYSLTGVSLPRYMVSYETRGFLAEWVSFSDPGRVSIFNLQSGIIEKSITTDFGAERVLISGGKLFVSNNFSNTLSIIDLETLTLVQNLEVGNGPAGLVEDSEGDVWVLCGGGFDLNYNPLGDGKLVEVAVANEAIKSELVLGKNVSNELQISPDKKALYYYVGTSIYSVSTSANEVSEAPLVQEGNAFGFYGLGVGKDGKIYAADAKDFTQNGEVFIYSAAGTFEKKYSVGRIPNGFSFN